MDKKKNLVLIDGHALAFRQYYALERTGMRTSAGVPSWAVFGFFKALFDLLKNQELQPDALAVTFDVSHHTFRTAQYSDYKANREKMPDDMQVQMGLIYEGLQAFNIPIYQKEGFEADDVIGTITRKACELGHKVFILTGDQDSFQLIDRDGCVRVIIPSKGELINYDWDKVYDKLGVYPNQVIDYKALRGDTSDNIPGIRGIGEKTATKLLGTYSTLDEIYNNVENIKEKALKEKLLSGKDVAYLSQYLATIVRDVDIDFDFDKACVNLPDLNKVTEFLTKLQLFSFLKNIKSILATFERGDSNCSQELSQSVSDLKESQQKFLPIYEEDFEEIQVSTIGHVEQMVQKIRDNGGFFFLTDVDYENVLKQKLKSVAIGVCSVEFNEQKRPCIQPYGNKKPFLFHVPLDVALGLNIQIIEQIKDCLGVLFADKNLFKITFDTKKEFNSLRANGFSLENVVFDAVLASYVENPANTHDLEIQALQCLNIAPVKDEDLSSNALQLGLLDDNSNFKNQFREMWLLMELTRYRLETFDDTKWKLLSEMEIPLAIVLAEMEACGVAINSASLNDLTEYFNSQLKSLETSIFQLAGVEFNINSPKQVSEILFEKMGIKHKKKSRGKASYSTSAEVLEELAEEYEIAGLLLQYRKFAKLKSTYTDAFPHLINPIDNRIHTTYNQTITATGRLSSSNPNLQNIPVRTDEGEKIRAAFVAEKGENLIVSADYSQIELRLLAHVSGDSALRQAFVSDLDVHTMTAANIFQVSPEDVTKQMRSRAKSVNFGIIYGQTRFGLAKALGISNEEAGDFIARYFLMFPAVKTYMDSIVEQVMTNGYAETIFGRKRYFQNEISSSNAMIREFAKRAAINYPMQGSAADLMKLAMIRFSKALKDNRLKSRLILQVHDEMVVETERDELHIVKNLLRDSMELEQPLSVPLVVNIEEGASW